MSEIQRRVRVRGKVQGVGYRASTLRAVQGDPEGSTLRGFVRNLEDGSVEAVFAGPQAPVLRLVAWCEKGPPSAQVTELRVLEEAYDPSLPSFAVRA